MTVLSPTTSNSQNLIHSPTEDDSLTLLCPVAEKTNSTAIELVNRSNEPTPDSQSLLSPEAVVLDLQNTEDPFAQALNEGTEEHKKKGSLDYHLLVLANTPVAQVYKHSDSVVGLRDAKQTGRVAMARYKKSEKCCIAVAVISFLALAATFISLRVMGQI